MSRPVRSGRTRTRVAALLLLLAALGVIWQASRWTGHNGDHFYYTAMALQFSGVPHQEAMAQAAAYFHYWQPARALDYGFQNPQVAPLIFPRTLLPLLAVLPIKIFGVAGIWFPGLAAGIATTLLLTRTVATRFGRTAVPALLVVLVSLRPFTEFGYGVYTDSLAILIMAAIFLLLPNVETKPNRWRVGATCLLVVLLSLTRQLGIIPHLLVIFGWIAAFIRERHWRNAWLPYLLVLPVSWVCSLVLARWAPYDVLSYLMTHTGTTSVLGALLHAPARAWPALRTDVSNSSVLDLLLYAAVTALAGLSMWRRRSEPWTWAVLGSAVGALAIYLLDGRPNDFRYLAPVIPALAIMATGSLTRILQIGTPAAGTVHDSPPARSRRLDTVVALGLSVATIVTVTATAFVYRPLSHQQAHSVPVSSATFGPHWPLRVDQGRLVCVESDEEVWFVTPDGVRYAFSGTAMSRSFLAPRLTSLAGPGSTVGSSSRLAFPWPGSARLLAIGLAACRV